MRFAVQLDKQLNANPVTAVTGAFHSARVCFSPR